MPCRGCQKGSRRDRNPNDVADDPMDALEELLLCTLLWAPQAEAH